MRTGRRQLCIAVLALLAASLCSVSAFAAEPCIRELKGTGKAIEFTTPLDEPGRIGLSFGLANVLSDPRGVDWPIDETMADKACPLGELEAAGVKYSVFGGTDRRPLRWARVGDARRMVFLTPIPPIEESYALYLNPPKSGTATSKDAIFALVLINADTRRILRIYDAMPAEAVLRADMVAALEQRLRQIATFDVKSNAVSLNTPVKSGRQAMLWSVPDGKVWARLTAPDGDHFVAGPGDGVRMAKSRFVCPATAGGYELQEFTVIDGREGSTDLLCKFFGDKGWMSVFVTRYSVKLTGAQSFTQAVHDAKESSPVKGSAPPLMPAGSVDGPERAETWTDQRGMRQGVLQSQVGQWHAKMRATYPPEEQAGMEAATKAVFASVSRDMSPDRP